MPENRGKALVISQKPKYCAKKATSASRVSRNSATKVFIPSRSSH